jgi:hypothetical protein
MGHRVSNQLFSIVYDGEMSLAKNQAKTFLVLLEESLASGDPPLISSRLAGHVFEQCLGLPGWDTDNYKDCDPELRTFLEVSCPTIHSRLLKSQA